MLIFVFCLVSLSFYVANASDELNETVIFRKRVRPVWPPSNLSLVRVDEKIETSSKIYWPSRYGDFLENFQRFLPT